MNLLKESRINWSPNTPGRHGLSLLYRVQGKAARDPAASGCGSDPRGAGVDVPIYHEWIGTLDGLVNATIRAQVTGYLLSQDYREGDAIKKGDLLFQIDPRPFQAVLDQANGQLAQTEARQGKTELDVKRYAPLVQDKAISQE